MAQVIKVKKLKPTTPGRRFRVDNPFSEITHKKPFKPLTSGISKSGGRNNTGKMTVRHIGGGHKRRYRAVDFKRNKFNVSATVKTVEYDPNRSAFISLLHYVDGAKLYILGLSGLSVGDKIISGENIPPDLGNALPLKSIPLGTEVSGVELKPGCGAVLCRSAGASAQVLSRDGKYVSLKMPSKEIRSVLGECMATVGVISNPQHRQIVLGKAGRNRWRGKRPSVRGVAMNPVDHPMGGGEGKASGGHPRSVTGLFSKGKKTRDPKKYSSVHIKRSRKQLK